MTMAHSGQAQFREVRTKKGKRQFQLEIMGMIFMMLPSDMALGWCPKFRTIVDDFDRNRRKFPKEALAAWVKLTELGVPAGQLSEETY